jgi:hypothetical protein
VADGNDEEALQRVRTAIDDAIGALQSAGARDEALAEYVPRRRALLITREPVLRPLGRVWRLGVLLLDSAGTLRATGKLVRATPPGRTQYQSESAEERRAFRAAAQRGHFADGETVNFDARVIELTAQALGRSGTSGPLFLRDGHVLVRWSAAASDDGARAFADYVGERVDLLAHPPEGA